MRRIRGDSIPSYSNLNRSRSLDPPRLFGGHKGVGANHKRTPLINKLRHKASRPSTRPRLTCNARARHSDTCVHNGKCARGSTAHAQHLACGGNRATAGASCGWARARCVELLLEDACMVVVVLRLWTAMHTGDRRGPS